MCCHIFRCCGWIIDIIQRFLTFLLACILCFALCCGFVVVLGAGIAYGYNISIVEYLDLKKADITVYVRRGQFGDKPPFKLFRRSGDETDLFSSNHSVDYQDQKLIDNTKSLSDAWQKAQDTSNYADKLTKYSKMKSNIMRAFSKDEDDVLLQEEPPAEDKYPPFAEQEQFIPESTISSNDRPKMRNFLSGYRQPYSHSDHGNQETKETRRSNRKHKHKKKKPEVTVEVDDSKSLYLHRNASKFL